MEEILNELQNTEDLMEEVVGSGTHNNGDVAKNLDMLMDDDHPLGIESLSFPENGNTDGEDEDDQSGAWDNPDDDWLPNWADPDDDGDGTWDWNDSHPTDPSKSIMARDNETSLQPWIFHLDDSAENKFADVLTNSNEELHAKGVATDLEHGPGFEEPIVVDHDVFSFGGMTQSMPSSPTDENILLTLDNVMPQQMLSNNMTTVL